MFNHHSLRIRIIKAFCALGLILSFFYAVFVYVGLEYLEDYLETNIYQKRMQDELDLFLKQYRQDNNITLPRSSSLSIYLSQSSMPENLSQMVNDRSEGIYEDDAIVNGKENAYHFIISKMPETGQLVYLFYDTGFLEINKRRMPAIILILTTGLFFVFFISIWIGLATSRKIIAPVAELSELIKKTDPDHLPTDLSKFYYHDEVGTLASALEQAMRRIQLFNQREQQFTRNASHELRTPVTIIKGAVELLKQTPEFLNPAILRPVLRIERSIADMEDTVDSFLWLAREKESLKTDEKCDVVRLLEESIEQHRYLIENKSLGVEINKEDEPRVNAPAALLKIIFGNLIKNAFHNTLTGKIILIIKEDKIVIEDTGVGIPSELLNNVTQPNVRGKESRGLGIGLAIVQMICDRFGWQIDIKSKKQGGTRVELIFPDNDRDTAADNFKHG